ncbi:lysine decarboxylase DesA, partial [Streptomyces sp. NPDC052015]
MRSHLLNDTTADRYRRSVTEGIERVAAKLATTASPFTGITVDALAPRIERIDLDRPLHDTTAVLDELEEVYLRDAVYFHHPRYLAHLNCPVVIPAVVGEAILSAVNSSLDTWDQSAGGTLIERKLIDWTNERIGLGPAADGVFTSGGSQSNLQALLLAREEAKSDDLARLRVFASEVSHFSVKKSAKLLGLSADSVVSIPVDHDKRMQTVALAHELDRCKRDGLLPMAVVATAGTTDFGSIDPLPEIAELCAQFGAWMHVDAAYGCGLLTSLKHRDRIDGIERA